MSSLGDIRRIKEHLRIAPTKTIKSFHKLIFGSVGDRQNRQRLRQFTGFEFDTDSEQFETKVKYIRDNFSEKELISIGNLLIIDDDVTVDVLIEKICKALTDISALASVVANENELSDDEECEELDDNGGGADSCACVNSENSNLTNFNSNSSNAVTNNVNSRSVLPSENLPACSFSNLSISGQHLAQSNVIPVSHAMQSSHYW